MTKIDMPPGSKRAKKPFSHDLRSTIGKHQSRYSRWTIGGREREWGVKPITLPKLKCLEDKDDNDGG